MSVATMLSRILGLVREQLIATLFSRTATDAFYVAFRIPNLLRDLFAEGNEFGLRPYIHGVLEESRKEASGELA
jgi:putative peptidoglycan lipid II flippase